MVVVSQHWGFFFITRAIQSRVFTCDLDAHSTVDTDNSSSFFVLVEELILEAFGCMFGRKQNEGRSLSCAPACNVQYQATLSVQQSEVQPLVRSGRLSENKKPIGPFAGT